MPFVGRTPRAMVQHARKLTWKFLEMRNWKKALLPLTNQKKTKRVLVQPVGRSYTLKVYQSICGARLVLRHKSQKYPQTSQFRYDEIKNEKTFAQVFHKVLMFPGSYTRNFRWESTMS